MLTLLSPAKTLDFDTPPNTKKHTTAELLDEAQLLVDVLAKKSAKQLGTLMKLSEKLAQLNYERYQQWQVPFSPDNAKQAILAFQGDVYQGLTCDTWAARDFTQSQKQVRILSGLYGVLRPLDLIQPYRLEMGTKLKSRRGSDLYAFWGDRITQQLNADVAGSGSPYVVNLASQEYFKSVRTAQLDAEIITPVFKDQKNGNYKVISFFAKKARGMMADFIVRNRCKSPEQLTEFDTAGYYFDAGSSDDKTLVFLRDEA